nr:hypothetical protein [Tanacetum cinerariifolium]
MATTIEQQVALDEALVPSTQRLRIGRRNFRLPSDIQSKESTLQLIYEVLRRCPFFKAFLVTTDVHEIYMQEFWATAYVHQRSIRFKINNKKHIVDLESFREMLHICPRIPGQAFAELPFEEEILEFIRFLGHVFGYLKLKSCGDYIDYALLIWEDFVYQVEHKKSNEMYYPRFTKVIIHHFMSKDPSIPRRNKINWHYVRDDSIFSTIKYYAFATGEAAPKPKASARRKMSGSDTSITPPTATTTPTTTVAVTPRLTAAAKGKQPAKAKSPSNPSEVARTEAQQLKIVPRRSRQQTHISQLGGSGIDEGTCSKPGVPDVPTDESEEELSWNYSDDEGADDQEKVGDDDEGDEGNDSEEGEKTPESSEDEGDGEEDQGLRINKEKGSMKRKRQMNSTEIQTNPFAKAVSNILDAADLSEMELKKILIEKMEGYKETVILKRRRDDDDDQEEGPSAGSDRRSKRWIEGKEPESASALLETATRSAGS